MSSSKAVVKAKRAPRKPVATLTKALHDFEAILSDDEKQRLYSDLGKPDASAVINFATEIDSNADICRTRCLGQRLISPLKAVQQFSEIVDTFVSSYPQIAALVWGGVKLALLAANNVASYFEKISALFMSIGTTCPQFKKFGTLYPDSEELQTALCNYYAAIIRLCRFSLLASRKSEPLRLLIATWRSFEIEFNPYVEDLKRLSEEVKDAIALASQESQVDQANHSRRALSALRAKARRDDRSTEELRVAKSRQELDRKRMRALEALSTYNHEKSYQQNRNECLPGTSAWVCESSTFKAWLKERSKLLWCTGKLGSGKSVISTCVIAHVFKEMSPNDVASYFFCRHDDEESLNARNIVGSIARQLVEKLPLSNFEYLEYRDTDVTAIVASLATILSKQHRYFILLDGLDECEKRQAKEVMEAFDDLMKSPSLQIKVYCSGRPILLSWLSQSVQPQQHIDLETAENQNYRARDIASVINGTLRERLQGERPELKIGNPNLVLTIQDRLREGAQGMFLWVKFQLLTLCAKKTDEHILAALQDLPKDLRETFERILRRLIETDDTEIGRKIFRWAAIAKRPLTIDELREAIAIKPLQKKWDSRKLVNNMIEDAITCCGNLIFLDEEYQTIHFTHSSVKQYLLLQAVDKSLDRYRIDLDQANAEAGAICVTYLNLPTSSNQVARRADVNEHLTKIPSIVIGKSLPNVLTSNRLALALLNSREGSDNAIRRRLTEAGGDTEALRSQPDLRQHSFRSYAQRFWLEHTSQKIDCEYSRELWNLWLNLLQDTDSDNLFSTSWTSEDLMNRDSNVVTWIVEHNHCSLAQLIMTSEIWPTFDDVQLLVAGAAERGHAELVRISVDTGDVAGVILDAALQSAAMFGHLEIVNILLSGLANVNVKYPYTGITALQAAAGGGYSDIVERLLHENADVNAEACTFTGRTALQAAAEGGHLPVVMRLLEGEVKADVNAEPSSQGGRTALQAAAGNGHLAVLTILLNHGADVNAAGSKSQGATALQAAASNGDLTIVNTLLEKGANVNAEASKYDSRTALQAAAEHGNLTIVNILLEKGAEVNAKASFTKGKTAIQAAAKQGNLTIIERLFEKGATINDPADPEAARKVLQAAVESGHLDAVDRILEALENEQVPEMEGVNAPSYDNDGRTALQAAAGKGYLDVVNRLLDKGAYVNAPSSTSRGRTALQAAAEGGYLDVVNRLLDLGADVNAAAGDIGGRTALQAAAQGGCLDVVNRLLDLGVDVNAATSDMGGKTALQAAAGSGHIKIVDRLLFAGAKLDAAPCAEDGRTALQAAAEGGHLNMVDRLLHAGAQADAAPCASGGRTALQAAAGGGHLKIVDRLLHAGAKADAPACEKYGRTALQAAKEGHHLKVVERLKRAASQDQPNH